MPSYTGDITVGRTFTTLGVNAPAGAGLTVDPSTPPAAGWNGNGCTSTGNAVTASFTAPANALLLALADTTSTGSGGSTIPAISDSGGLSWIRVAGTGTNGTKDEAVAWWARTSSSAARTVTLTLTSSTNTCSKFLQVVVVMNTNLTTPIGATNIGPAEDTTAGVFNQSVTSTAAGSMAFAAVADAAAAAIPTPGSGVTLQGSYHQTDVTGAGLYKTAASSAPGQALTITTTAPATATNSWSMFEVLPAGASNTIFGPGWTASMPGPDAGAADETLAGGYVTFTDDTGVQDVYTRSGTGGYPYTYTGVGDDAVDGSTLTKDSATQFTHTDIDGSKTVFVAQAVGGVTTWYASQVVEPGSNTTSTFTTDSAGRTTRILADDPAGVSSCTTLGAGCRALNLTYATSTSATGTGTDPSTWGSYTGRVSGIAMAFNGAAPVNVAAYAYDFRRPAAFGEGPAHQPDHHLHLRHGWPARPDHPTRPGHLDVGVRRRRADLDGVPADPRRVDGDADGGLRRPGLRRQRADRPVGRDGRRLGAAGSAALRRRRVHCRSCAVVAVAAVLVGLAVRGPDLSEHRRPAGEQRLLRQRRLADHHHRARRQGQHRPHPVRGEPQPGTDPDRGHRSDGGVADHLSGPFPAARRADRVHRGRGVGGPTPTARRIRSSTTAVPATRAASMSTPTTTRAPHRRRPPTGWRRRSPRRSAWPTAATPTRVRR